MTHEQLWAPWRLGYVKGDYQPDAARAVDWLPGADQACFLCRAAAENADRENLVVWRGTGSLVVLNRFPYNNGHLLVATRDHLGRLDQIPTEVQLELLDAIGRMIHLIERLMNAEGFNVGMNLGRVAGAGVPGHLHWHVVPRWTGDTNFMPMVAAVEVIPQSLDALWQALTEALAAPHPESVA